MNSAELRRWAIAQVWPHTATSAAKSITTVIADAEQLVRYVEQGLEKESSE